MNKILEKLGIPSKTHLAYLIILAILGAIILTVSGLCFVGQEGCESWF